MSWAADRTTTRVEDRAYSLMGLLGVNMPMLYGEGKKAFHRLQLEIIRTSNDQSIFAWGWHEEIVRTGGILADDPSFFGDCSSMELMDPDKFVQYLKFDIPEKELPSIDLDRFGVFPITNRGIQIWLFFRPYPDSNSVFEAWLPCRYYSSGPPVSINLALWNSNYYRYSSSVSQRLGARVLQFHQVYLAYQDTYGDVTFEIDDSVIIENGFTCCDVYPQEHSETVLTLTGANPFCARVYSDGNASFVVECGQFLGQDWIHVSNNPPAGFSEFFEAESMLRGPERVRSMVDVPSRTELYGRVRVNHISLPESTWIVRTWRVVWERSRIGVRMEVFHHFGFYNGLNEWKILGVEVGSVFVACTWHCCTIIYRELMTTAVTCGVSCWTIVCHVNVSIYYT